MNINLKKAVNEVTDVTDDSYMNLNQFQNFTDTYVESFNHVPMNLWQPFFETLLGPDYAKFNTSSKVLVMYKDYFKKISLYMAQTPTQDLGKISNTNILQSKLGL